MINKTYIYVLKHPEMDEVRYVGKTNNIKRRLKAHLNPARFRSTHKFNWIKKLREEGLKPVLEIVEECDKSVWKDREKHWIQHYINKGCKLTNCTEGGDGLTYGNKTSFKKGEGGKAVVGYNKDGEKVYEFKTASEAAEELGVSRSSIANCANLNHKAKTILNLAWFYKKDIENYNEKELLIEIRNRFKHAPIINETQFKKGQKSPRAKEVVCTSSDGFNKEFESGTSCANYFKVSQSAISLCINNNKLLKKKYEIKFK